MTNNKRNIKKGINHKNLPQLSIKMFSNIKLRSHLGFTRNTSKTILKRISKQTINPSAKCIFLKLLKKFLKIDFLKYLWVRLIILQ